MDFRDYKRHDRTASSEPTWALVAVIVLIGIGVTAAYYNGYLTGGVKPGNVVSSTGGPGLVATTLPISFATADPLAQASLSTVAITAYSAGGSFITSCTTSSGSCSTTGQTFTSGQNIVVSMSKSTYVTEWIPLTVPFVPQGAAGITSIPVSLYEMKLGTWAITFLVGSTVYVPGTTAPIDQTTVASTVKATISNTVSNTGYLGCNPSTGQQYDIINKLCQSAVVQISDTGVALSVTGMPRQFSSGSTRYWFSILQDGIGANQNSNAGQGTLNQINAPNSAPESAIFDGNAAGSMSTQTIGLNTYGGTTTVTLQVGAGSLAAESNETLIFAVYVNADPNFFPANNNLGPNTGAAVISATNVVFEGE